jgi:hypothetical protein
LIWRGSRSLFLFIHLSIHLSIYSTVHAHDFPRVCPQTMGDLILTP